MFDQKIPSVVDVISALPDPYPTVSLAKHYKGTTIKQLGRIIDINPVSGTIQVSQRLTFPILSGIIHMLCEDFPGAISATIHPIDYTNGTFQLSDLSYGDWVERKAERVQPKCPTYISMQLHRSSYRAFMIDISSDGMGILVNKTIDKDDRLRPGVKLLLDFQLPPEHLFINLKSTILYRKNVGQQLTKYGLQLLPNASQKNILQSYVTQRYDEILNELEQEYIWMSNPFRVENQCF
jgi:hypothetical protein